MHGPAPPKRCARKAGRRPAMTLKYTSFRSGSTGLELRARRRLGVDVHDRPARRAAWSRSPRVALERGSSSRLTVRRQIRPRSSSIARNGSASSRISPRSMIAMRLHSSSTSSTMCVERITTLSSPISREQVEEADALLRIEPRRRLVDDDQLRVAEQRDGDAEALPHAAGEGAELAACAPPTGWSAAAATRRRRAASPVDDALQHREVLEQPLGRSPSGGSRTTAAGSRAISAHLVLLPRARRCRRGGSTPRPAPAAWRGSASASTCRRRSGRAGRTSRAESSSETSFSACTPLG